jgi:hypothetical protein
VQSGENFYLSVDAAALAAATFNGKKLVVTVSIGFMYKLNKTLSKGK